MPAPSRSALPARMLVCCIIALLVTIPIPSLAATWRWTGLDPSSSAWTRPQNWDRLTAPANDGTARVVFGSEAPSARHQSVADLAWDLEAIELEGNLPFTVSGAALTLASGIQATKSAFPLIQHRIENDVRLSAENRWATAGSGAEVISSGSVDVATHRLVLSPGISDRISLQGDVSGQGPVRVEGFGTAWLSGSNSYMGGTTVDIATLEAKSSGAIAPGTVTLKTGRLVINAPGTVLGPGDTSTADGLVLGGVLTGSPTVIATDTPLRIATLGDWIVYDATDGPSESLIAGTIDLDSESGTRVFRVETSTFTTEELVIYAAIVNSRSLPGGAPAIVKRGGGHILLSGINTFARALRIEEGAVLFLRPEAVGASGPGDPTVVVAGAELRIAGGGTIPNETLRLNGLGIAGQGALVAAGNYTWGGPVFLESDAAIGVTTEELPLTISGPMQGSGGLTKVGLGGLVLTAANGYQGATRVAEGILRADNATGRALPGEVTVQGTGTLAGEGSAGAMHVLSGGTIDPARLGSPNSSLSVTSADFAAGSTLHSRVIGSGDNARLDVAGEARLAGKLEAEIQAPYQPAAGHTFTLVTYGSRVGTFDDVVLPPLASGLQWSIEYGTNSLIARVMASAVDVGGSPVMSALLPPSPNPFAGATRISYRLATRAETRLEILDLSGRMVAVLADGVAGPGSYDVDWGLGPHAPPGIYFARLRVAGQVVRPLRRLVVMR